MTKLVKYVPIYKHDEDEILLYDIYIDDKWYGSRRTYEQCEMYVKWLLNT